MLEQEIKKFTEELYEETFGNGQNTPDEFDWEDIASVIEDTAKHFAEWQKVQDQKTIELAEDHAMLAGMNKMEQQMMEKAVEGRVGQAGFHNSIYIKHPDFTDTIDKFDKGDKVKIIIVKEN